MVLLYTEGTLYKYGVSLYSSLMFLWANDLFAITTTEILVVSTVNFLGMFVIGLTFGEMLVLFYEINAKTIIFQKQLDLSNSVLSKTVLKPEQITLVNSYLKSNKDPQYLEEEFNEFLRKLSPSFKSIVNRRNFGIFILKNNRLFKCY